MPQRSTRTTTSSLPTGVASGTVVMSTVPGAV
jgi:hypothetical protein